MRAAYIDVEGVSTRYFYEGSGPALLLVHGVGASADNWIKNIDGLGRHFTVYAPDNVGSGFTDIVDLDGEPPQLRMVRHLGAFMEALGVSRYSVVGHSYGGLLASLLYFDRPQCIDRLVLASSGSTFLPPDKQKATLERSYSSIGPAAGNPSWETCRVRKSKACFDPASVPDSMVYGILVSGARPGRPEFYKATMEGLLATAESDVLRVYSRLEQIDIPTLVFAGREDGGCSWELIEEGCGRMPQAELIIFEKCGHIPMLEHPERFDEAVIEFLTREPAAAAGVEAATR